MATVEFISDLVKSLEASGGKTLVLQRDSFSRPLVSLNRATQPTKVEIHEMAADIVYVVRGIGTIETGSDVVDRTFRSLFEWRGTEINNSQKQRVGTGDFLTIPAGMAHQTIPRRGEPLIYLTTKRYLADYWDEERLPEELNEKIKRIKGLIMDVDGTMTDGKVWVNQEGVESVAFSRIDSLALLPWQGLGRHVGIISRETVPIIAHRAEKLKLTYVHGILDKVAAAKQMAKDWGLDLEEVCYIGDDVNDLPLMRVVGLSACPSDAQPQVLKEVGLVVPAKRGEHVIRKLLDLIFLVQLGKYPDEYERKL